MLFRSKRNPKVALIFALAIILSTLFVVLVIKVAIPDVPQQPNQTQNQPASGQQITTNQPANGQQTTPPQTPTPQQTANTVNGISASLDGNGITIYAKEDTAKNNAFVVEGYQTLTVYADTEVSVSPSKGISRNSDGSFTINANAFSENEVVLVTLATGTGNAMLDKFHKNQETAYFAFIAHPDTQPSAGSTTSTGTGVKDLAGEERAYSEYPSANLVFESGTAYSYYSTMDEALANVQILAKEDVHSILKAETNSVTERVTVMFYALTTSDMSGLDYINEEIWLIDNNGFSSEIDWSGYSGRNLLIGFAPMTDDFIPVKGNEMFVSFYIQ